GAGVNESRTTHGVQSIDREDSTEIETGLAAAIESLQEILPDVPVVLFREEQRSARIVQFHKQRVVDRRHINDSHAVAALLRCCQSLMNATAAADDDRRAALLENMAFSKFKRIV